MPRTPPPEAPDELLEGLPPVVRDDARVLVLGSMPGARSLDEARYYAHPRNAFWPIVGDLAGVDPDAPYEARLTALVEHGIALWDVIGRCRRRGSLDARIEPASIEVNDVGGLVERCPQLGLIAFNGARAEQEFRRRLRPDLDTGDRTIETVRLPSTSPAHASLSLPAKRRFWHEALGPVLRARSKGV